MTEYTKIETARTIICDFCNQLYSDEPCEPAGCDWIRMLQEDAADVAPVVRCRDCKYWQDNNDGYPHEECRWGNGETPNDDDFCSFGERMGGDSDAAD